MKTRLALPLQGVLLIALSACAGVRSQPVIDTMAVAPQNNEAPTPIPADAPTDAPVPVAAGMPAQGEPDTSAASPSAAASPQATTQVPSPQAADHAVFQQIAFAHGSAEIPQASLDSMTLTVTQLQQVIGQDKHMRVEIVSYTDVAGEGKDAAAIGDSRAWRVHSALLAHGLSIDVMRVVIPPLLQTPPALAGKVVIRLRPK